MQQKESIAHALVIAVDLAVVGVQQHVTMVVIPVVKEDVREHVVALVADHAMVANNLI